jgi:hypothetical protein
MKIRKPSLPGLSAGSPSFAAGSEVPVSGQSSVTIRTFEQLHPETSTGRSRQNLYSESHKSPLYKIAQSLSTQLTNQHSSSLNAFLTKVCLRTW